MSNDIVFRVKNHHVESCGSPPVIDDSLDDVTFRSYFENDYGEQWILLYNQKTDEVLVFAGDCGWENKLRVISLKDSLSTLPPEMADKLLEDANTLGATKAPVVAGDGGPVILGKAEQMWVAACMEVIDGRRKYKGK
jgi:hypothetical protein